jgi:hypothetical protein
LRELEGRLIRDNTPLIVNTAKAVGEQLIIDSAIFPPQSNEEACVQRYIYVPILYKLGFTKEAAKLAQTTFEYLFPQLHLLLLDKLHKLFNCDNLNQLKHNVIKLFSIEDANVLRVYARMKSTNSIWKKIESIQKFQSMEIVEFVNIVDDFIALRWNMKINEDENRYDSLLNGIHLVPKNFIIRFRNQQVEQQTGFSCEPVMKFYYVIQNVPVELQLLGGLIENYMCAKGYANYKIGCNLNPLDLTEEEQNARLGICIYHAEHGCVSDFNKMMLNELTSNEKIYYEMKHTYIVETVPNNPNNLFVHFSEIDQPIYMIDNHTFESKSMHLSGIIKYSDHESRLSF